MPSANADYTVSASGLDVVRIGNYSSILVQVYNNNSTEDLLLDKIEIYDEKGLLVQSKEFNLSLKPIAQLFKKQKNMLELSAVSGANLTELSEVWNKTKDEISKNTIEYIFSFDVSVSDCNKDGQAKMLAKVYAISNGTKNVIERNFTSRKTEPLPEIFEDENGKVLSKESAFAMQNAIPTTGWYAGDVHTHSKYSYGEPGLSGDLEISYIKMNATAKGLSWFALTDHSPFVNDFLSPDEWYNMGLECNGLSTSSFKCLQGLEIGGLLTDHYLAYNTSHCIDCGIGSGLDYGHDYVDDVNNDGGFGAIAHPFDLNGVDWKDWGVPGFSVVEVWNFGSDGFSSPDSQPMAKWNELAKSGRFYMSAGSDSHTASGVGTLISYCRMPSLTSSNILSALQNGRCVISNGPMLKFSLNGAEIGDNVSVAVSNNTLVVDAYSTSEFGSLDNVEVFIDGVSDGSRSLGGGYTKSISIPVALSSGSKYVYLRLYTTSGYQAVTNPIWIDSAPISLPNCSIGKCTVEHPCPSGFGDCDMDSNCLTGLCALNKGSYFNCPNWVDICITPSMASSFATSSSSSAASSSSSSSRSSLKTTSSIKASTTTTTTMKATTTTTSSTTSKATSAATSAATTQSSMSTTTRMTSTTIPGLSNMCAGSLGNSCYRYVQSSCGKYYVLSAGGYAQCYWNTTCRIGSNCAVGSQATTSTSITSPSISSSTSEVSSVMSSSTSSFTTTVLTSSSSMPTTTLYSICTGSLGSSCSRLTQSSCSTRYVASASGYNQCVWNTSCRIGVLCQIA